MKLKFEWNAFFNFQNFYVQNYWLRAKNWSLIKNFHQLVLINKIFFFWKSRSKASSIWPKFFVRFYKSKKDFSKLKKLDFFWTKKEEKFFVNFFPCLKTQKFAEKLKKYGRILRFFTKQFLIFAKKLELLFDFFIFSFLIKNFLFYLILIEILFAILF